MSFHLNKAGGGFSSRFIESQNIKLIYKFKVNLYIFLKKRYGKI